MDESTAYDRVHYVGSGFPQTHPRRLATVAALFGLDAPSTARCTVLELGCGDGANLIPMAASMPQARFLGIDLAPTAIERGRERVARIGLANVELVNDDVTRIGTAAGRFDYVIAHGLYSWVPPTVRPHVMRVFGELLSPCGVAYVSYNALPGCRLRHLVRDLVRLHFGTTVFEFAQVDAVRAFLADVRRIEAAREGEFLDTLKREIDFVLALPDHVLFHDDLAPESHAFALDDVLREAAAHGLQFLGEAGIAEMFTLAGHHRFDALLDAWSGGDRVAREQRLDHLRGRRFRQTLLCRAGHVLSDTPGPERLHSMHLRSRLRAAPDAVLHDRSEVRFAGTPRGATLDEPIAKVALALLGERYPDGVAFHALLRESLQACAAHGTPYEPARAADALAALCWSMVRADLLEPLRDPVPALVAPGERPRLRPIVADALRHGLRPVDRSLHAFDLDDPVSRAIALAMDGHRDRAALLELAAGADDAADEGVGRRLDALIGFLHRSDAFDA